MLAFSGNLSLHSSLWMPILSDLHQSLLLNRMERKRAAFPSVPCKATRSSQEGPECKSVTVICCSIVWDVVLDDAYVIFFLHPASTQIEFVMSLHKTYVLDNLFCSMGAGQEDGRCSKSHACSYAKAPRSYCSPSRHSPWSSQSQKCTRDQDAHRAYNPGTFHFQPVCEFCLRAMLKVCKL